MLICLPLLAMSCKSGKSGKDPSPVLVSNLHQVNPDKGQVQVEGYRKLRDGGEGMFYWRQTRQPLNDGGMYVASSVRNNGMWVRHVGKVIQSRHYGLPLGMDEDVSQRVQAMITAADRERIPEIFFSKGVYVLNTVTMGPGIHFRGEEGSILKKKARAKKFDRMFTTQGLRYYGKEDSPAIRFSNLVFDGSLDAQGPYQNYELEHQAIIFLSARDDSPGRLRARIDDCTFSNGVGDAIHIYRNVDAIVRNCSAHDVFRGGVTVTGGNSIVVVDSFRTDGDLHPTGIDVEIDGAGYQGSYAVDIRMTNLNLAGDFDVAVRAGQFYGQHIYCGGSPVYVAGRDGEILIEDSELRYALEDPMKIVVPHRVTFRRCRLVAQGSFETSARVDPGIMVQWNAGGSQRQNNSVTFEDCDFDYKRPAQRNSTRPAAALYNNAGNKDDQNELVFTRCSFSSAYDYGIFLNQGGMLTMDSCTIGGPNGIYVGSSNTQRAYNYKVSIKDMEMKQSGATAVEYKEQERNEIQVTGKSIKLKPVKGLSKTKVKRIEK